MALLFHSDMLDDLIPEILQRCTSSVLSVVAFVNKKWATKARPYLEARLEYGITMHTYKETPFADRVDFNWLAPMTCGSSFSQGTFVTLRTGAGRMLSSGGIETLSFDTGRRDIADQVKVSDAVFRNDSTLLHGDSLDEIINAIHKPSRGQPFRFVGKAEIESTRRISSFHEQMHTHLHQGMPGAAIICGTTNAAPIAYSRDFGIMFHFINDLDALIAELRRIKALGARRHVTLNASSRALCFSL